MLSSSRLAELLKKYDVPGPRYTSYPTVPAWTQEVGPIDYQKSLAKLKEDEKLSLYFHLPFCENLCHFCGCTQVITKDHSRSKHYVDQLFCEIKWVHSFLPKKSCQVTQLHFGGGTPNFLQPEELSTLVLMIREYFQILLDAEVAIEMHPKTSTPSFCEILAKLGFNRISLGIQDFDEKVQTLINRFQTYQMTCDMMRLLRSLGFTSFNFDLVYGLPGQTMEGWKKTLASVLELKPNRLAVYSYAHVPWVRPVQRAFKESDLPAPQMKLRFFEEAYLTLIQNGYSLIGMDHFALADDELSLALKTGTIHRNFMGYSTQADAHQLGFGMSAISFVAGNYFQNAKELKKYEEMVSQGHLPIFRGSLLTQEDAIRRDLITKIMCQTRVDLLAFERQWNLSFVDYFKDDLPFLNGFVEDGLLEITKDQLKVKNEGLLFLRNMAMPFDRYLEGIKKKSQNPTFSRTV